MRTLVILSAEDISKLARNDLVVLRGNGDGDIIVIMSEECHRDYVDYRDRPSVTYGLRS